MKVGHSIRILLAACAVLAALPAKLTAQAYAPLPSGTLVQVRIIEKLSSGNANVGDQFHGTLAKDIVVNGRKMFPKGADVTGEVIAVERSGRLSHPGELHLDLRAVRYRGRTYAVAVEPIVLKGDSHTKSNIGKIGGGAAAGAIIGRIASGGKGAAIGAGVGAAAGTGVAAATGKKEAVADSEAVLVWVAANAAGGREPEYGIARSANSYYDNDHREKDRRNLRVYDDDDDDRRFAEFSERDRWVIRGCFGDSRQGLPPGLAKKDRLPPGLERHLQRNGTLPPGLQKKVQPLPSACEARLPRLPHQWARVVLGGRIILLDPGRRIIDLFWLDSND